MSDQSQTVFSPAHKIKINKWRVREGFQVNNNHVILLYELVDDSGDKAVKRLKSTKCGIVKRRHFTEGDIVDVGQALLELSNCIHATVIKDMCADCGADLRQDESHVQCEASVPMVHSVPELKVSQESAQKLGKADTIQLLNDRRLVLLVDLDQTVIHTTNDNVPHNLKGVYHFQLYGANSPWYHTRLRPGTFQFLENIAPFYELHICTFGARNYAHTIAQFLDEDNKYFSHRILSRDECSSQTYKTENLRALFPCGDSMVCIIDDREDVWNMATNLIQVKPYHFFQHTGDINAPPGMSKHELDGKGVDFGDMKNIQLTPEVKTIDSDSTKLNDADALSTEANENIKLTTGDKNDLVQPGTSSMADKSDSNVDSTSDTTKNANKMADENNHDKLIEIDDPDDYLLYLEEILKKIHGRFYTHYDETKQIPDLKTLLPKMRSEVLVGKTLVFSGLVPTQIKLEKSKAYLIARSLGANVTQLLTDDTTHLVASTAGTFKVNAAKKNPKIHIVSPDWLWTCAERWECVDENVFPLDSRKASKTRQPPAHCHSPEHAVNYSNFNDVDFSGSEIAHSSVSDTKPKFIDTINPLLSFSNDDLKAMNEDVDFSDSSDGESVDYSENPPMSKELRKRKREEDSEDVQRKIFQADQQADGDDPNSSLDVSQSSSISQHDSDEDGLGSASDLGSNANTTNSSDGNDDGDDGEWNMMGAALEREFLGLDESN